MQYGVEWVKSKELIRNDDGSPVLFPSGKEAQAYVKDYNAAWRAYPENRMRVKPYNLDANTEWQARERQRIDSGYYRSLYFQGSEWFEKSEETKLHFAHVSIADTRKVSFTPSIEYGVTDRQTTMRVGRYLKQFYSDRLNAQEIEAIAVHMDPPGEVLFAKTPDEIERVYTKGPSSCMSYAASHFESSCHPVRAYSGPDLAVAYLERASSEKVSGCAYPDCTNASCQEEAKKAAKVRIVSRCLVWPDKRRFGRIYGDETRLRRKLEDLDYCEGSFEGARMTLIQDDEAIVCPYLDVHDNVYIDKGFLVIGHKTGKDSLDAKQQEGHINGGEYCEHCESGGHHEDDMTYVSDRGEMWCDSCFSDDGFSCEDCGDCYSQGVLWQNGICESCSENYFVCNDCDAVCNNDDGHQTNKGEIVCDECASNNYIDIEGTLYPLDKCTECEECNEWYLTKDGECTNVDCTPEEEEESEEVETSA